MAGNCSNCHTMHNSQNGASVVQTYAAGIITTGVSTPQPQLLVASCIACHSGSTGEKNSFGAPIVVHTINPVSQGNGHTLAGGDFYWVATGLGATDSMGHNVYGLAAADGAISDNIGNNPPGWDPNATLGFAFGQVAGGAADWLTNQLSCDGIYGCHGQHSSSGITGAHHSNTGLTSNPCYVADTIGNSYRFLGGIKGLENADWNWNETVSVHNEYYGVDDTSNRNQLNSTYANNNTISFSCAECHGYFHSRIDDSTTGSPWLRHPTDIALPDSGEYQYYTTYSLEAPIARHTEPASPSPTVAPGTDIVMCLSCHRAHGSPFFKIMRWDYKSTNLSEALSGCNICHTSKD